MQYNEGTVSTTAGSATITGDSTAWLASIKQGDEIQIGDDLAWYTVGAVISDTSLTITVPYPTTQAGADYVINQDFTTNLSLPKQAPGDLNAAETFTRAMEIIDAAVGPGTLWISPVISITNAPPGTPAAGDRYIISSSPSGAWVGHAWQVAQWSGSDWAYTTPTVNTFCFVTGFNAVQFYTGALWTSWNVTLKYVGNDGGSFIADGIETGTLKVTGGTPAAGAVLMSDASGGATWQDPNAIQQNVLRASAKITLVANNTWYNLMNITTPAGQDGAYMFTIEALCDRVSADQYVGVMSKWSFWGAHRGGGAVALNPNDSRVLNRTNTKASASSTLNLPAFEIVGSTSPKSPNNVDHIYASCTLGGTDTTTLANIVFHITLFWVGYTTAPTITIL